MDLQVTGFLGVIHLILVIWAIIKIGGSTAGGLSKFLWIAGVLFFPLIGFIIWFFVGPKAR